MAKTRAYLGDRSEHLISASIALLYATRVTCDPDFNGRHIKDEIACNNTNPFLCIYKAAEMLKLSKFLIIAENGTAVFISAETDSNIFLCVEESPIAVKGPLGPSVAHNMERIPSRTRIPSPALYEASDDSLDG
ncbi:hypothetical protein RF11_05923 [Thelohanellus kitauei]|uniref:Uncharacterized protein n=1 Tax=Thelohanellus kitauei TaxID=669202 RepID=A0A0C2JK94_THEKT|nr:hypothetical protein RF11_05923 [Thelohanellus kitauei]